MTTYDTEIKRIFALRRKAEKQLASAQKLLTSHIMRIVALETLAIAPSATELVVEIDEQWLYSFDLFEADGIEIDNSLIIDQIENLSIRLLDRATPEQWEQFISGPASVGAWDTNGRMIWPQNLRVDHDTHLVTSARLDLHQMLQIESYGAPLADSIENNSKDTSERE